MHRDLKPANIKIKPDGTVKVLDFGLAQVAQASRPVSGDPASSPTLTISPTRVGMILGTAAYMSPEQARGKTVDKRADIWAFGVVLYELLTGSGPFHGEDITEIVASVVKEEPRLDRAPAKVRRLLRKCLEKDPKRRLRDIGDAWELLEDAPEFVSPLIWSPDGRFIAFAVTGKLKKVEASGGSLQTVCDLPAPMRGAAWSRDGAIAFGVAGKGLMRVSEAGGGASPLTTHDSSGQETTHSVYSFLPDGRHFVYQRFSSVAEKRGIYLGSLDAKPEQQSSRRLVATGSNAFYAPSADQDLGHLLFVREGSLMAQAFDARRLELAGEAVPIAEGLPDSGPPLFSVSTTGVLAYRTGGAGPNAANQLTWFDRAGKVLGTVGDPGQYNTLALSPDGTRVAFDRNDPQAAGRGGVMGNMDIWLHEFSTGISTRLTFDPAVEFLPVWSPDGSRIVFSSSRDGSMNLYQKVTSGAGNEEAVYKSNEAKLSYDWSPDGRFLLYGVSGRKSTCGRCRSRETTASPSVISRPNPT